MQRKRIDLALFNQIEGLDFCGPLEVFSATRMHEERRQGEPSPFEVILIAEKDAPVAATGGMKVHPDCTFENCPGRDILVVPGRWGARSELNNPVMLNCLLRH